LKRKLNDFKYEMELCWEHILEKEFNNNQVNQSNRSNIQKVKKSACMKISILSGKEFINKNIENFISIHKFI
jgi:hypothetical protein